MSTTIRGTDGRAQGASAYVDVPRGGVDGLEAVNKFGESTNVDSAVDTDIWDLTASQPIWLAPTAARVHAIVSADANDVAGISTLTLTGQPLDTETVTIGTKVYTFQTTLTDVDGNVKIGASASASIDNLIAAIMLTAGAGSTYAASMTANAADITAAVGAGDTMSLYDNASANIATTETLTNGSWDNATTTSGTGARTVKIWGLTSWDTAETSETIKMNGVDSVNTTNSYVIIHRMKVVTNGSGHTNAGIIKATAATDSTITAQILAGMGQTLMLIYGVPSNRTFCMSNFNLSIIKAAAAVRVKITMLVNEQPDVDTLSYLTKHTFGLDTTGTSAGGPTFNPNKCITGPAIIKIQGNATANDTTVSGGFDGYLAKND